MQAMENGADLPRGIGVYTVERELGAGGMGTVYPARRVAGFQRGPVVDADPDAEVPWPATAYIPGPSLPS
ncbi:hypothetical protein [Streptomyces sp. NPDC056683]|uniref:hypothetical protein n=1 Tax=Streptomyces sp. NPDC056683 TaxID=3345910 RepID=UPI0036C5230D